MRVLHSGSTGLIFNFIDISHNEVQEEAEVYSFPTLRLYPANTDRSLTWLDFTDTTNFDELIKFLRNNTKATNFVVGEE